MDDKVRLLNWVGVTFLFLFGPLCRPTAAQDDTGEHHAMLFWLAESYLKDVAAKKTIRYPIEITLDDRSNVHAVGSDCELHVAWLGATELASPGALVAEPPNVCKKRLPGVSNTRPITTAWADFFDTNLMHQKCTVTGFPRIFSEHSSGGGTTGSNADHVLEIHPMLAISCQNGTSLDFASLLKIFPGMRKITDDSAATCIEQRKLWVRKHGHRYEFAEEGAKGPGGRCGNFVALDATLHRDFVREFDPDSSGKGDHSAIAWVTMGDNGPFSLKIYTYRGTPEDDALAEIAKGISPNRQLHLHGLLTYDYLAIVRAVQDQNRNWLETIDDWTPIPHPLAFVVFGTTAGP